MAFTNAEKQRRWRERLHEQAGVLDGTPTQIATAILGKLGAERTRSVIKALEKRLRNAKPHVVRAGDFATRSFGERASASGARCGKPKEIGRAHV